MEFQYILCCVTGKNSEKILQTFAIRPLNQQVQVVALNGVFVDLDVEEAGRLAHGEADEFFVSEEAPPANRMMGLERDMQRLFGVEGATAASFTKGKRAAMLFFGFWQECKLCFHNELVLAKLKVWGGALKRQ